MEGKIQLNQIDQRRLEAASCWLELGDWHSANEELAQIESWMRAHPDVLKMRVAIYCAVRRFDAAAKVSDRLAAAVPKDAEFWLNRAVALCQLARWHEARAAILTCFILEPDLQVAALDNPDLAPLWRLPPAAATSCCSP